MNAARYNQSGPFLMSPMRCEHVAMVVDAVVGEFFTSHDGATGAARCDRARTSDDQSYDRYQIARSEAIPPQPACDGDRAMVFFHVQR